MDKSNILLEAKEIGEEWPKFVTKDKRNGMCWQEWIAKATARKVVKYFSSKCPHTKGLLVRQCNKCMEEINDALE